MPFNILFIGGWKLAKPVTVPDYYQTVLGSLRQIPWIKTAESYPQTLTNLSTPAVFLSLKGWTPGSRDTSGQISIVLSGEMLVLTDRSASSPDVAVQGYAAELTQWLAGQQFGLEGVEPAVFTSAAPYSPETDTTVPALNDYAAWAVNFTQDVAVGADPLAYDGTPLRQAWLGCAPETGSDHIDDYQLVYGNKEGRNG